MRADPETVDLMLLRAQIGAYDERYKAYLQAKLEAEANPQFPYLMRKAKELRALVVEEGAKMTAIFDAVNLPTDHKPTPKAKR